MSQKFTINYNPATIDEYRRYVENIFKNYFLYKSCLFNINICYIDYLAEKLFSKYSENRK